MAHKPTPSRLPRLSLGIMILILVSFPLLGCNLFNRITGRTSVPDEMSLEEALQVTPLDSRPSVMEEMGPPDAFTLDFQELEGQPVRWETWSYFDYETRFDFIDGELLWTIDLEPVPDGSIYAHWYDPLTFQAGLSLSEVKALLPDQELLEVDLASLDLEGGLLLAGDQILLGFEDDGLVYVETLILSPDPEGQPLTVPDAEPAPAETQAEEIAPTEEAVETLTYLQDDFESQDAWAVPIFTADFMEYGNIDGKGVLTTHYPGGLMVAYYRDVALEDFILELEINTLSIAKGAKAGVIFRAENPAAGADYYISVTVQPSEKQIRFEVWKDGEWAQWEGQSIPADLVPANGIYQLKVDCLGQAVRVYLKNQLAAEFTTSLITDSGYFGLALVSSRDPETVLFDNLFAVDHP